ncbi:hypothetical protein DFJ74DRAFT_658612 [Hyaloraphidium curvatum]|nr:hypothetical protein DFJ74DRAFT_658612 [Hyaloraphidium curvatum]
MGGADDAAAGGRGTAADRADGGGVLVAAAAQPLPAEVPAAEAADRAESQATDSDGAETAAAAEEEAGPADCVGDAGADSAVTNATPTLRQIVTETIVINPDMTLVELPAYSDADDTVLKGSRPAVTAVVLLFGWWVSPKAGPNSGSPIVFAGVCCAGIANWSRDFRYFRSGSALSRIISHAGPGRRSGTSPSTANSTTSCPPCTAPPSSPTWRRMRPARLRPRASRPSSAPSSTSSSRTTPPSLTSPSPTRRKGRTSSCTPSPTAARTSCTTFSGASGCASPPPRGTSP